MLFLDEFPEFSRTAIEALRQPLEDRVITVSRAKGSITFPADFVLVATSNPCPCGYYGSDRDCSCMPSQIIKYQKKISGPILDRIDLYVDVDNVKHTNLLKENTGAETSAGVRKRVSGAKQLQNKRYQDGRVTNASLSNQQIKAFCKLDASSKDLLDTAAERLKLSPRSYMRTIKVARTIADLENSRMILPQHIGEALQYRRQAVEL